MPDPTPNPFIEAFEAGLSPIPVDTTTKRPLVAWKTFQSEPADLLQCQEWADHNIGIVTGTVSGRLMCLDFETEFMDQLDEFVEALKADECYMTFYGWVGGYCEETPSGGMHVLLRLEGEGSFPGNSKLASRDDGKTLIETRAEGGYVIVAPSRNGNRGWKLLHGAFDRIAYATWEEWEAVVAVVRTFDAAPPPRLGTTPALATPSILRLGDSWIEEELAKLPQIRTLLSSLGWEPSGRHDDYGEHWVRPGKDPRQGHSASISATDRLYVHSSNAGLPMGNPTLDKLDVALAPQLGRRPTTEERTAYLRAQRPPAERGAGAAPITNEVADLNLPSEFWESRPYLAHIRQAALASLVSPDALWEAVKCLFGATIPWNHRLPGDGTMDYIGIVVGNSGAGKSSAKQEALNLLIDARELSDVALALPPGSGEGMTEIFLDRSDGDNKYRFRGVGFYGDEGKWLLDVNARQGNTTMQVLKQAWSGELTGSVAATTERHRWLAPRDVRVTVLISATPEVAAAFMRADLSDGGLPQRISWGWAHYPHPDVPPEHPGPLRIPLFMSTRTNPGLFMSELEPELATLIHARRLAAARGEVVDGLEGHATYAVLKGAAILAHLDGRRGIMLADWDLSLIDWEASGRIRQHLLRTQQANTQERNVAVGIARAHSRLAETDVYLERAVESLKTKLKSAKGPLTLREIKDHLRPFRQRHGVDYREAIAVAIERGWAQRAASGGIERGPT